MKKSFIIFSIILGLFSVVSATGVVSSPKRIVTLAPSVTEIVFALGLGDHMSA